VEEILGLGAEAFETDSMLWINRIHPDDREKVLNTYDRIPEKKKLTIEFRFQRADGNYIWLQDEIKLITDKRGKPHSLVGTSIEITDQKQAEKEIQNLNKTLEKRVKQRTSKLAKANKRLKEQHQILEFQELAINNLNDMVVITKAPKKQPLNSKIIFVNKAFEEFTGYQSDEILGRNPGFLHGPETSDEVLKSIERKIQNHQDLREEFINYKKDGTPYWVELEMSSFPTDENEYEYWVGINRNITKRKRAEQKLEESEQRYRTITELSFDAILEIDLDGKILNCNKKAFELFGYGPDELIGMDARKLKPREYRNSQSDIISKTITTGDDETWERTYEKKDGSLLPAEIHTQVYHEGDEKRLIAYIRDNSAHKSYENAIHRSLKEKETLLAEIHHRVKNNLAIISGLLEMQAFNTEEEQLLDKLRESQSRIQSIAMVHEKLYQSETLSEIAIDQYIDDLLSGIINSMVDTSKPIEITKRMDSVSLSVTQAIPCGLLLNELLTNCYKHAFTEQQQGTIYIFLQKEDNQITLQIADDGKGMPEDFNINQASSLGMTLVNTLVAQLDGDLSISSDAGTTFEISFALED